MAEIDLPFLKKKALESDMLVFFDFEATEYTHRAIEIGVAVFRKESGQLALGEEKALYRKIISCDDPVGPRVERLSGLTAEIVRQEGIPFSEVIKNIIDLCRDSRRKTFLSYSFMDMKIFRNSIGTASYEKDFLAHVQKFYLDMHAYLSSLLVDDRGQSLSVVKLLDLFGIALPGKPHDPLFDAVALSRIYDAIVMDREGFLGKILACYPHNRAQKGIDHDLARLVIEKGKTDIDDLRRLIEERL